MFDAIEIEKRGIPTVTIAHATFAPAAELHARVLGLVELPVIVEPLPESGVVSHDVQGVADDTFSEVLAALISPSSEPRGDER